MHEQLLHTAGGHVNRYKQSGEQHLSKTLKNVIGFDSAKPFLIKNPKEITEDTSNNLMTKHHFLK